jgi:hypothetical protein
MVTVVGRQLHSSTVLDGKEAVRGFSSSPAPFPR